MLTSMDSERRQHEVEDRFRTNWFLGGILALLSIGTAFYLDFEVIPHVLAGALLIVTGLCFPRFVARVPRIIWQGIPVVLVALLGIDLYLFGEGLPALVRLNLLLIVFRSLTFRRKREDLQLLVLCLFMIVIVGVLTVAMSFIVQILVFSAGAMWFLFNLVLMEHERERIDPKRVWEGFSWSIFLPRVLAMRSRHSGSMAGLAFTSLLAVSTIAFLIIPRVDMSGRLPFLSLSHGSKTGFSETMQLGEITNIKHDSRVALRVEIETETNRPPPELRDPYWRIMVLDEYRRGSFRMSHAVLTNSKGGNQRREVHRSHEILKTALHPPVVENEVTFYIERGVSRYLPVTGAFDKIRFQEPTRLSVYPTVAVFGTNQANSKVKVYRVSNMEATGEYFDPDFDQYSLEYPWHPEFDFFQEEIYTQYPETTVQLPRREEDKEVLYRIVDEILGGDDVDAEEFARRASAYLRQNHSYSLSFSLPPHGRRVDPIVRWLESDLPGHCEMFAGAFILLSRAAGFPARAVTGFRGGSWNAYENYYMVRYSDAHAWAEVYDDYGRWFRVDPTPAAEEVWPSNEVDEDYAGLTLDSSAVAYLDSLRIMWYRRIVSFDHQTQFQLFDWAKAGYESFELRSGLQTIRETLEAWAKAPWGPRRLVELLGIFVSGGILFLLICMVARRDFLRRAGVFFLPVDGCPVRRRAGMYLQRFDGCLPVSSSGETEEVIGELRRLRYGPEPSGRDYRSVFRQARRSIRQVRKRGAFERRARHSSPRGA